MFQFVRYSVRYKNIDVQFFDYVKNSGFMWMSKHPIVRSGNLKTLNCLKSLGLKCFGAYSTFMAPNIDAKA